MKQVQAIKGLNSQLTALKEDEKLLCVQMQTLQGELNQKRQSIKQLKRRIADLERDTEPKVSEHALVRYFERVEKIDISEIEKKILSEEVLKLVSVLGGNGTYPNGEMSLVFRNNTVVTIETN